MYVASRVSFFFLCFFLLIKTYFPSSFLLSVSHWNNNTRNHQGNIINAFDKCRRLSSLASNEKNDALYVFFSCSLCWRSFFIIFIFYRFVPTLDNVSFLKSKIISIAKIIRSEIIMIKTSDCQYHFCQINVVWQHRSEWIQNFKDFTSSHKE